MHHHFPAHDIQFTFHALGIQLPFWAAAAAAYVYYYIASNLP